MALMKCPECGREISDKAQSCPNCGYPLTQNKPNTIRINGIDVNMDTLCEQSYSFGGDFCKQY